MSSISFILSNFFKNEKINNIAYFNCCSDINILNSLKKNNLNVIGFSKNYHEKYNILDLSKINKFEKKYNWSILLNIENNLSIDVEEIYINNLDKSNKNGIILNWYSDEKIKLENIKNKILNLGYINDIETEEKLKKYTNNVNLKKTLMVFRKVYLYNQSNYKLCLSMNKPTNLNDFIKSLPKTKNIGNYIENYRKYFLNEDAGNFNNSKIILREKIMIDIGAHIGLSSSPILSLGHKVFCFEPEKINYELLKSLKKINNYDNMFIYNVAVGKENKNIKFYSNINREDNSSINKNCCKKNVCPLGIEEKIYKCITLDKWYQDNKKNVNIKDIKLIKIDTQGAEYYILEGAKNLLLSCSLFNNCNIELETDDGFMKEFNIDFSKINKLMNDLGFKNIIKNYDSIFIPKNPISNNLIIYFRKSGQLCNQLKNYLSCMRIQKYLNCELFSEEKTINNIFNLNNFKKIIDENKDETKKNIIYRNSWRFAIFNKDNNLDKIKNNKFALMFKDFQDNLFFKNYENNSIDFLYNKDLFGEIYQEYSDLFNIFLNENLINKKIIDEVNNFSNENFNEKTISIHIRSWVDYKPRAKKFNLNNFYEYIDKFNEKDITFFITGDNKKIVNKIINYQKSKNLNNIIIYENKNFNKDEITLIELLLLSKNNILIGSYLSTFTEMAFIINYHKDKEVIII